MFKPNFVINKCLPYAPSHSHSHSHSHYHYLPLTLPLPLPLSLSLSLSLSFIFVHIPRTRHKATTTTTTKWEKDSASGSCVRRTPYTLPHPPRRQRQTCATRAYATRRASQKLNTYYFFSRDKKKIQQEKQNK